MRYSPGPETGLTTQVTTAPAPGHIPDQPGVDCLDDSLVAEHSRPAVPCRVAFWLLASVFTATMLGSTLPTPLYVIYQAQWHFSAAIVTVTFAVYAAAVLATWLLAFSILLTVLCVFSLASIRKTVSVPR
jgi:hypothetical protein